MVYFIPTSTEGNSTTNATEGGNSTTNSTAFSNSTGLGATLDLSSIESLSGTNNQTGVQGDLSISEDFDFGVTISRYKSLAELKERSESESR